jgi:predicted transcriptional regulator
MISGIKEVAAGTIEKKMKKGVDPVLHKHMLLYKGDIKDYKDALGLKEKDTPYFFLLDKNGKIVYVTSGAYSDAKLEKAEEILEDASE